MKRPDPSRVPEGATRLGFVDVLTAVIVLAILLYAAWKQFPAFSTRSAPAPATSQPASPVWSPGQNR